MIYRCTCDHRAQDELHGKGNRVFNLCAAKEKSRRQMRCTVCGKVVESSE